MMKVTHRVTIFLLIALFLFLQNAVAYAEVFRCGNNIVNVGDSTYKVHRLCGAPTSKEIVGAIEKGTATEQYVDDYTRQTNYDAARMKIEKWEYNKGYGDYIYILTFEGGILKKVESGGRGN